MKATQLYRKHNGEKQCNIVMKLTVEFLPQNIPNFIEPFVWPPISPDIGLTPSVMPSGVLCSKMCTEFRLWVWRISKTECIPAGPVSISN